MRSLFLFRHFVAAILFLSLRFLITSGSSSFILWNTKRRSHKLRVCMKMVLRNVEWKIANNHIVKFITGNYSWAPVKFCQSGAQSLKNNVFPTRENNELLEKFFLLPLNWKRNRWKEVTLNTYSKLKLSLVTILSRAVSLHLTMNHRPFQFPRYFIFVKNVRVTGRKTVFTIKKKTIVHVVCIINISPSISKRY